MSPISETLKQESWQNESNLPLVLLEIDHADLAVPICVVNDKIDVTSNSVLYTAFPFEIILPDSREDAPPRAQLRIDNVSREIAQAIRSISTPPSVSLKIIRRETPDIIEAEFSGMRLVTVPFDVLSVSGYLEFEDLTREPYPAHNFNPSSYRGIL